MIDGTGTHNSTRRELLAGIGATAAVGLAGCLEYVPGSGGDTQFVTIGTGGTGGVYYPLGGGIANVLNNDLSGVRATAESTGASVENCRLVASEDMTMGFSLGNSALLAVEGKGDFDQSLPLVAAFGAYINSTQVVTRANSGITSISDMKGKRISVGAPGSGTEVIAKELLDFYGLSYDDINEQRLSFSETGSAIQDGQLDAGFWSVAYPASSIQDLASQRNIRLLDFPDSDVEKLTNKLAYYTASTIPAGTYPGQNEPVLNPGVTNVIVVHRDMNEQAVYRIVQAIYTHIDQLADVHPAAKQFPETAQKAPIDLHPGAKRYFEERSQ